MSGGRNTKEGRVVSLDWKMFSWSLKEETGHRRAGLEDIRATGIEQERTPWVEMHEYLGSSFALCVEVCSRSLDQEDKLHAHYRRPGRPSEEFGFCSY